MKAIRICICGLGLLMLLAQCALCAQVWTERKITTGAGATTPKMWGDTVYWVDERNYQSTGMFELRSWTQPSGEQVVRQVPKGTSLDSVYEDKLVYHVSVGTGNMDLYQWDPVHGEVAISTAPGYQYRAAMWGDTVVWDDTRSGVHQIYLWDSVNGEQAVSPTSANQQFPKIWGDTIVWEDYRNGQPDVYKWDPLNGAKRIGSNMVSPAIYDGKVAMWRLSNLSDPFNIPGLYMWSGVGPSLLYRYGQTTAPYYPGLWGNTVVYSAPGGGNVVSWDPVNGLKVVNQSEPGRSFQPSIYGNQVAWIGYRDVYLSTLVPEPGGLVALSMGLISIFRMTRRRRAW